MADHRSHPDRLMAQALGVCWHSPGLSAFWPCTPLADWELELVTGWSTCTLCGHPEIRHNMEPACDVEGCECDHYEGHKVDEKPA